MPVNGLIVMRTVPVVLQGRADHGAQEGFSATWSASQRAAPQASDQPWPP